MTKPTIQDFKNFVLQEFENSKKSFKKELPKPIYKKVKAKERRLFTTIETETTVLVNSHEITMAKLDNSVEFSRWQNFIKPKYQFVIDLINKYD